MVPVEGEATGSAEDGGVSEGNGGLRARTGDAGDAGESAGEGEVEKDEPMGEAAAMAEATVDALVEWAKMGLGDEGSMLASAAAIVAGGGDCGVGVCGRAGGEVVRAPPQDRSRSQAEAEMRWAAVGMWRASEERCVKCGAVTEVAAVRGVGGELVRDEIDDDGEDMAVVMSAL
ncbi:hypothetical protein HDU93_003900 [Gonapodya sp. JEL0774]|nr:hypothetical protein HDU93_003900 [Gonapodya sp. JEL0774]